jgi:hypothetical protein
MRSSPVLVFIDLSEIVRTELPEKGDANVTLLILPITWNNCFSDYKQATEAGDVFVAGNDVNVAYRLIPNNKARV